MDDRFDGHSLELVHWSLNNGHSLVSTLSLLPLLSLLLSLRNKKKKEKRKKEKRKNKREKRKEERKEERKKEKRLTMARMDNLYKFCFS